MKVLYINGNPQSETSSYSRRTAKYLLEEIKTKEQGADIEIVNVYETDIPLIDHDVLSGWHSLGSGDAFDTLTPLQQEKIGKMQGILKQFKEADLYIIASPLWNFSVTPLLKAYIDNISIAGETFKYTENGPVGLLDNKQLIIVQASGGIYSEGPAATFDHSSNYLADVFGFLGIRDIEKILIEGVALPDNTTDKLLEEAYKKVDQVIEELWPEEEVA